MTPPQSAAPRLRLSLDLMMMVGLALFAVAALAAVGRPARHPAPRWSAVSEVVVERRVGVMGTLLSISLAAPDRRTGLAESELAVSALERTETLLSTWKPGGPLERLDRARPGEEVALAPELAALLDRVFDLSRRTGRAFDPTVLPLVRAWGLRSGGRVPDAKELARALAATGPALFRLDARRGTARRLSEAAGIDEGAWGKGYGLDLAGRELRARGVQRATLDLGGQVLALGSSRIGIADPRDRSRSAAFLSIEDASVSTSGNSERGISVGGRRMGHLLDPRSGLPAYDFGSTTVVAPTGLVADILSTALFVEGPERGLALSKRLRDQGIDHRVLYLLVHGRRLEAVASSDLHFTLEDHP